MHNVDDGLPTGPNNDVLPVPAYQTLLKFLPATPGNEILAFMLT